MQIKSARTSYNLACSDDVRKLKNSLYKMYSGKKQEQMLAICKQVESHSSYNGNDKILIAAKEIYNYIAPRITVPKLTQPSKDAEPIDKNELKLIPIENVTFEKKYSAAPESLAIKKESSHSIQTQPIDEASKQRIIPPILKTQKKHAPGTWLSMQNLVHLASNFQHDGHRAIHNHVTALNEALVREAEPNINNIDASRSTLAASLEEFLNTIKKPFGSFIVNVGSHWIHLLIYKSVEGNFVACSTDSRANGNYENELTNILQTHFGKNISCYFSYLGFQKDSFSCGYWALELQRIIYKVFTNNEFTIDKIMELLRQTDSNEMVKEINQIIASGVEIPKAPIEISYRDEGKGNGAFYDHYTIQKTTGYLTKIAVSSQMNIASLKSYINTDTEHNIPFWLKNDEAKSIPEISDENDNVGLLIIPGRARETETKRKNIHTIRTNYENKIIRDAINRGRPILGICAGSWQLWNSFYNLKKNEEEHVDATRDVNDHNNGSGMPRVRPDGKIKYNIQIHKVSIQPKTILAASIGGNINNDTISLTVNSVHWRAPDENKLPDTLVVNAKSLKNDKPIKVARLGEIDPEVNIIEGFETKDGAPVLGIQWHPEAYNANDPQQLQPQQHRKLLQYMAKAGDAYSTKQKMLTEFKQKCLSPLLAKKGLFGKQSNEANRNDKTPSQNDIEQTSIQHKK